MMKKAEIVEPNKPLVISEVSIPEPPDDGLVVKIAYCGICHFDLNLSEDFLSQGDELNPIHFSDNPLHNFPFVPGHEISGVVHSLGSASSDVLKVGDRVVIYPWIGCGKCGYCENDNSNLCMSMHEFIGFNTPGGYANYLVVRDTKFALKVPDSISLDVACMFACSALTAYSAVCSVLPFVEKSIKFTGSAKLLIIGAGGLALWCIQFAKNILPASCTVTVANTSKEKLEVAKSLGCDDVLCWDPAMCDADVIKQTVSNGQYAGVIDFVNNTATANRAVACVQNSGIILMIGLIGGQAHYSLPQIVFFKVTIQGIITGNLQLMKDMIKVAAEQQITPPPMQYYKLQEVNDALGLVRGRKMKGRGILTFTKDEN